ncbi:hypothetical protein GPUN_0081 [Glaciecola punicea ACAM 611]|uniref:Uncharacterized protein n=1 Tax=Glaciecola punicea ACAM 611 TaxID=1121923 RepID=H5T7F8_9ALTE|nr:hypothetical protein [Glaciecola punicea]GAB54235.1 hypothetical protein GPUN_0081 [Glaciecola punicea ACAM 611]
MNLFFERTHTPGKTIIVFKPYSMYLLLIILAIMTALTFTPALVAYEHFVSILMPVAAAIIAARIVLMYKVNKEIQQAIREDTVKVTGGKLSAKNPLTFEITQSAPVTQKPEL